MQNSTLAKALAILPLLLGGPSAPVIEASPSSPGSISTNQDAYTLAKELKFAKGLLERQPILDQLTALGPDGRGAALQLLREYRLAIRKKSRLEEAQAIQRTLTAISAGQPHYDEYGIYLPFCSDEKRLLQALEAGRKLAAPSDLAAFLSIRGVLWDLASMVQPEGESLDVAIEGLLTQSTSPAWAAALRGTFSAREYWAGKHVQAILPRITKGASPGLKLYRGISLWGRFIPKALVSELAATELAESSFPERREALAFFLGCGLLSKASTPLLLALLSDEDASVRNTAIWAVGNSSPMGFSRVPFPPTEIPGGASTAPYKMLPGFGYRATDLVSLGAPSSATLYTRAEYYGAVFAKRNSANRFQFSSEAAPEIAPAILERLAELAEIPEHASLVYWTRTHLGHAGGDAFDTFQAECLQRLEGDPGCRDQWLRQMYSMGGLSQSLQDTIYALLERDKPIELTIGLLESLSLADPERAQPWLVASTKVKGMHPSYGPLLSMAAMSETISAELAEVLSDLFQRRNLAAAGLLLRCDGGVRVLTESLSSKTILIRLTALVALTTSEHEDSFMEIEQMLRKEKDSEVRAFIEKHWHGDD